MRTVRNIAVMILVILAGTFTSSVFAQSNTAVASVSATIVAPMTLSKTGDMNFGNTAVAAGAGGSVTIAPNGARTMSGSGLTLPSAAGTVSAAGFTVSGAPDFTYAITLPSSAVISGPGSATMIINSFTSIPSATGTLNSTGTQSLAVGATLNVSPGQQPGFYTNATALPVTVNYN